MQPATTYALQRDCSADCTVELACQGCGRCEVKVPTAKCSCCSESHTADDDDRGGCCGHTSQRRLARIEPVGQWDVSESAGNFIEEQLDSKTTCESERSGLENQPAIKASELEPNLSHACTCFTNPKPLDAPSPRSPNNEELRDLTSGEIAGCVAKPIQQQRQESSRSSTQNPSIAAHFVQIVFGVWRL